MRRGTGMEGVRVQGWQCDDVVFELHTGQPHAVPRHSHDAYQIGTTTRDPGEYLCDGKTWIAPPGSLLVFHPGQVHSAPSSAVRRDAEVSRLMFVRPERMAAAAAGVSNAGTAVLPHFAELVIRDRGVIERFCRMHQLALTRAGAPEKEARLEAVLGELVSRYAKPLRALEQRCHGRVQMAREYVESNYTESISLGQLAALAHISPYHLSRVFSQEVGMPPHAFQTQLRVQRAKPLLLAGMPVTEVAMQTGFFDQSHFIRHFRRIVGVTPSSYAAHP
jgi:AraC-like DNA-binding protein